MPGPRVNGILRNRPADVQRPGAAAASREEAEHHVTRHVAQGEERVRRDSAQHDRVLCRGARGRRRDRGGTAVTRTVVVGSSATREQQDREQHSHQGSLTHAACRHRLLHPDVPSELPTLNPQANLDAVEKCQDGPQRCGELSRRAGGRRERASSRRQAPGPAARFGRRSASTAW